METPNPSNLRELIDDEVEKALKAIETLASTPPVKIDLGAHYALVLIGILQLNLGRPCLGEMGEKVSRDVIAGIRKHLPDSCQSLIDAGFGREPQSKGPCHHG